jgi:glutamine synthetase
MFDGSSIAGWKAINESDMTLMPDPTSFHTDPFYAQATPCCSATCSIPAPARPTTATRA